MRPPFVVFLYKLLRAFFPIHIADKLYTLFIVKQKTDRLM